MWHLQGWQIFFYLGAKLAIQISSWHLWSMASLYTKAAHTYIHTIGFVKLASITSWGLKGILFLGTLSEQNSCLPVIQTAAGELQTPFCSSSNTSLLLLTKSITVWWLRFDTLYVLLLLMLWYKYLNGTTYPITVACTPKLEIIYIPFFFFTKTLLIYSQNDQRFKSVWRKCTYSLH